MRLGITFGCYIPLHKGHMQLIEKSIQENDKTIIAVCGKVNDRGKDFIPFDMREALVYEKYEHECINGKVNIVKIDDEKIGMDGTFSRHNWELWCNELFSQANEQYRSCGLPEIDPESTTDEITWYTGEQSYKEKLSDIYPHHTVVLADRSEIDISGTKIRENPEKYVEYIAEHFLKYMVSHGLIDVNTYNTTYNNKHRKD